jgi:hypothetical protein
MSTLKADTIVASDGSSPVTLTKQSAAKAWANFTNLTTFGVNGSFNCSSVTDIAVGAGDPQFTNNMNDANYSATGSGEKSTVLHAVMSGINNPATDHLTVVTAQGSNNAALDCEFVFFSLHGDLA